MILCVALNAALDVTYTVDAVRWHAGNRVTAVRTRAGGKGTNVAGVLHALGEAVTLTGFAGGGTGADIRAELARTGLADALVPMAGESRRTVAVVDSSTGDATGFWEPGPTVSPGEWESFTARFAALVAGASVVVLSGSAPTGVPEDGYGQLIATARAAGVPAVLDADGALLRRGVQAGPAVVKPNRDELVTATGRDGVHAGALRLRDAGAAAVVVSAGAEGLLAATAHGCWSARPPTPLSGNPTGAGDACVAALARGLARGHDWPRRLAEAVALSAAAVLRPVAGEVDHAAYRRILPSVQLRELPP